MQQTSFYNQPVLGDKPFEQLTGMCLLSAAVMMTYQILHQVSLILLKALWSDEGKAILGSSVFYPTVAMTVLFIVARMVPTRVVKYCTGFCKRKALAVWNRIRKALANLLTLAAKFATKRSRVMASVRIMLGAIEMFCL